MGTPKISVVSSSEVGTNCGAAERFTGGECQRIDTCKYPEKKTCKAYSDRVKIIRIPYRVHAREAL
jgi:hypothetical protein